MSTALFLTYLTFFSSCFILYSNLLTYINSKYKSLVFCLFDFACADSFAHCRFWIFNYEKHLVRLQLKWFLECSEMNVQEGKTDLKLQPLYVHRKDWRCWHPKEDAEFWASVDIPSSYSNWLSTYSHTQSLSKHILNISYRPHTPDKTFTCPFFFFFAFF